MTEPVDVARLERLEAQATSGPWVAHDTAMMHVARNWANNVEIIAAMRDVEDEPSGVRSSANREFIAAVRNAAPSLLAAYRERDKLRAEKERLDAALADIHLRAHAAYMRTHSESLKRIVETAWQALNPD